MLIQREEDEAEEAVDAEVAGAALDAAGEDTILTADAAVAVAMAILFSTTE